MKKVCRCFASISSEQEHFTRVMYMTALIRPLDVKIEPIMFYEGIIAKVFRRSISFAIAAVVTSCSSSLEYVLPVHADAAEKCVYGKCCKISNTLKLRTPKIIAENNF